MNKTEKTYGAMAPSVPTPVSILSKVLYKGYPPRVRRDHTIFFSYSLLSYVNDLVLIVVDILYVYTSI